MQQERREEDDTMHQRTVKQELREAVAHQQHLPPSAPNHHQPWARHPPLHLHTSSAYGTPPEPVLEAVEERSPGTESG